MSDGNSSVTGPDYLNDLAERAATSGQPYADLFQTMIQAAFADNPQLIIELVASRELKEHEASPVSIILAAHKMALDSHDAESAEEVLRVGLALLAKWAHWLCCTADGHPDLELAG